MNNPMGMMQIVGRINIFRQQHPKFEKFLRSVSAKGLTEGSIMEMKFKSVDGEEYVANIKLTAEDIETIQMLRTMGRNG